MLNHPSNKQLSDLKKQFTTEEKLALRARRQGDIMNYLRRLKVAKRLRTEFHQLADSKKTAVKAKNVLEEILVG